MRPSWKGFLKLSLVNIPIRMYAATSPQSLSFNQLHVKCNSRIKYDKRCPTCEVSVGSDEIVKGYEYAKDQYVIVSEEDFAKVRLESNKAITIVQFVDASEIDPIYYHSAHYLVPDGAVGEESFATILKAMEEKGRVALAKVVLSGKEQVVAIRPRDGALVMSALYYADEVRSASALEEVQKLPQADKEGLALATQLIDRITQPLELDRFEDNYRNALLEIVKAKAEGREVVEPPQVETGKVINLMDALKSSLERMSAASPAGESATARAEAESRPAKKRASR
jgi:DNA end-binding protein Ku